MVTRLALVNPTLAADLQQLIVFGIMQLQDGAALLSNASNLCSQARTALNAGNNASAISLANTSIEASMEAGVLIHDAYGDFQNAYNQAFAIVGEKPPMGGGDGGGSGGGDPSPPPQ